MAAALAGDLTMGVMTARSLSGGAKQTADLAKSAGKGSVAAGLATGKGAAVPGNGSPASSDAATASPLIIQAAVVVTVVGNRRTVMPCWLTCKGHNADERQTA